MRKYLIPIIVLLVCIGISKAIPVISDVSINPSNNLWFGEDITISAICTDENQNNSINRVFLNVTGPDNFLIPDWSMATTGNNTYYRVLNNPNKSGDYKVNIYCENNENSIQNNETSFKISEFTTEITSTTPNFAYIGDEVEIGVITKINTIPFSSSGIKFNVTLGSNVKIFDQTSPATYDGSKWKMKINVPDSVGIYDIIVKSDYDRTQTISKKQIEIKQPLQFDLVSIDKNWVKKDDNITLTFQAAYKGQAIDLTKNNLKIWIDNNNCEISETSRVGSYSYVKLKVPNLSPGEYNLKIKLTYENFVKEISEKIYYIVSISGDIINADNKGVSATLEFRNNKITKSITTDSNGHYSTEIPIGSYDIELIFPKSKVILSDVNINGFEDPIRYDEASSGIDIEGIGSGGAFVYEFALDFDDAYIEMRYDDSRIPEEDKIVVYRCENWNFGKRLCNGKWNEVAVDVDTIRNFVKLNTTSLSTFLVGYKKEMLIDANADKNQYFLNDIIKVLGIAEDEEKKPIADAEIKGKISGTNIEFTTKTDNGGVFTTEFQGPDKEGNYELYITSEKSPYKKVNQTIKVEFVRSKKLSLTLPSNLKIKQGENTTTEFLINNIGQTDFRDLKISIEGLPYYYTIFEKELSEIKSGEEKRISIVFEIPKDASIQTYTGKVKVKYSDGVLEDDLILSIEKAEETLVNKNSGTSGFNLLSGKIILPSFSSDALFLSLFGILSIGGAIWFKKRQKPIGERGDIKNLLLDIKREVERDQKEIKRVKTQKEERKESKKRHKGRISYAS